MSFFELFELHNILYYQFKPEKIEDYRILWDGKLFIIGSEHISLHIDCHYRFDNNPITQISNHYFEISNGFTLQF